MFAAGADPMSRIKNIMYPKNPNIIVMKDTIAAGSILLGSEGVIGLAPRGSGCTVAGAGITSFVPLENLIIKTSDFLIVYI